MVKVLQYRVHVLVVRVLQYCVHVIAYNFNILFVAIYKWQIHIKIFKNQGVTVLCTRSHFLCALRP